MRVVQGLLLLLGVMVMGMGISQVRAVPQRGSWTGIVKLLLAHLWLLLPSIRVIALVGGVLLTIRIWVVSVRRHEGWLVGLVSLTGTVSIIIGAHTLVVEAHLRLLIRSLLLASGYIRVRCLLLLFFSRFRRSLDFCQRVAAALSPTIRDFMLWSVTTLMLAIRDVIAMNLIKAVLPETFLSSAFFSLLLCLRYLLLVMLVIGLLRILLQRLLQLLLVARAWQRILSIPEVDGAASWTQLLLSVVSIRWNHVLHYLIDLLLFLRICYRFALLRW